jgi:hypothetical protein
MCITGYCPAGEKNSEVGIQPWGLRQVFGNILSGFFAYLFFRMLCLTYQVLSGNHIIAMVFALNHSSGCFESEQTLEGLL